MSIHDTGEVSSSELTFTGVINAGGRGTRLYDVFEPGAKGIAKATLDIGQHTGGASLRTVDHQINQYLGQGAVENVVVSAGDQGEVAEYVDRAYRHDERVDVVVNPTQKGTAGDLIDAVHEYPGLFSDYLIVNNVDTIVRIDYQKLIHAFAEQADGLEAMIALSRDDRTKNGGAYAVDRTSKVVWSDEFGKGILPWELTNRVDHRATSTGVVILDTDFVQLHDGAEVGGEFSIYKDLLERALAANALGAYDNGFQFTRDIGTPESWALSAHDPNLQGELWYSESHEDDSTLGRAPSHTGL